MSSEEFENNLTAFSETIMALQKLVSQSSSLITSCLSVSIDEYEYDFARNSNYADHLRKMCKRMIVAKSGLTYPDKDSAFEDFSRNAHLQIEGLITIWYKDLMIPRHGIAKLSEDFVILKIKEFFSRKGIQFSYIDFIGEINKNQNATEEDLAKDYINLSNANPNSLTDNFINKYQISFDNLQLNYADFKLKVFKFNSNNIDKINFSNKAELFFHFKKTYYVGTVIHRLTEYRNKLSHPELIDTCAPYYTELVGQDDRVNLIMRQFSAVYRMVAKDLRYSAAPAADAAPGSVNVPPTVKKKPSTKKIKKGKKR